MATIVVKLSILDDKTLGSSWLKLSFMLNGQSGDYLLSRNKNKGIFQDVAQYL